MRSILLALLIIACHEATAAKQGNAADDSSQMNRAVVLAIQQEVYANHLEKRTDVCVGFGNGLAVDEKEIMSTLLRRGLKLRSNEWCNHGPRGFKISIIAPITESAHGTYDLILELADLRSILQKGEHFATLLRRGNYIVKCQDGAEPDLVAYRKTCCPETGNNVP